MQKKQHALKVEADGWLLLGLHIIKNGQSLVYGIVVGAGRVGAEAESGQTMRGPMCPTEGLGSIIMPWGATVG